jgi:TetR/AcrR family transcriptional repressor of nem operon
MGHSQAEKAQSRERIVSAAAQIIRERGIDALSIGELMRSVGLTHGAFYVHFESRDALVAAALERALLDGEAAAASARRGTGKRTVKSILNNYLSRAHRDAPGAGCAVAALAGDVARSGPATRRAMVWKLEQYLAAMAEAQDGADGEAAEDFALAAWSAMVGAVVLSRVFAGDPRSDRLLSATRQMLLDQEQRRAAVQPAAGS